MWAGALTRMDDGRLPKRVMIWTIKNGGQEKTGRARERVGGMRGKRRPVVKDPTKLETRSLRCPEEDRNSHRGRAEVYDRVEEGGRREVQIPLGEENRQIAREPSIHERDRVG